MEDVTQERLKKTIKFYYNILKKEDYIQNKMFIIKTMHPDIAHSIGQEGYTYFEINKKGEITQISFGHEVDGVKKNIDNFEDGNFIEDTDLIIISIVLNFNLTIGTSTGNNFAFKFYNNGVLSVYPNDTGEICNDENLRNAIKLLIEILILTFERKTIEEDCIDLVQSIKVIKDKITEAPQTIKKLNERIPKVQSHLVDAITTLVYRIEDSQNPDLRVRSIPGSSISLRVVPRIRYPAFGTTGEETTGEENIEHMIGVYKSELNIIVGSDNNTIIDIFNKPQYIGSCENVIRLVTDFTHIAELSTKIKDLTYKLLENELKEMYDTSPKTYDNREEFEKQKKSSCHHLKSYLQENLREYRRLNYALENDIANAKSGYNQRKNELRETAVRARIAAGLPPRRKVKIHKAKSATSSFGTPTLLNKIKNDMKYLKK